MNYINDILILNHPCIPRINLTWFGFVFINLFILFIFGCVGSSLLCTGFL